MLCDCGLLVKKRTLLDGIKSITGTLVIFAVSEADDEIYLKKCCFLTIVPSLYTFVHQEWINDTTILIYDPSTIQTPLKDTELFGSNPVVQNAVKVKQSLIDKIMTVADDQLNRVVIDSCRIIGPEYTRVATELNLAYHQIIHNERILNDLRYKYSSAVHDNEMLHSTTDLVSSEDDSNVPTTDCERCKNINSLKTAQKELKRIAYEQINTLQYELEIIRKTNLELQIQADKLRDENVKLKEVNKALYMSR